ncbi:hypothetical protein WMY93_011847 [Mugilogobius chulae]|uniref:Uncharacterized protein n=1 Tax=Mugilogobius chulae TaxID=88201 RepID=A0AAW0P9J3_9GOBI
MALLFYCPMYKPAEQTVTETTRDTSEESFSVQPKLDGTVGGFHTGNQTAVVSLVSSERLKLSKMCAKLAVVRALMQERLTAAAEEIFALVERTIAEFEEELCRSKEENQRK